jgi:ferritin-like metal-binding protein YciE
MAIESLRDLVLYELGVMRDAERTGWEVLMLLAMRTQDDPVARLLHTAEDYSTRHLNNLGSCLEELGAGIQDNRSTSVEGIRERYNIFLAVPSSSQMRVLFSVETALRLTDFMLSGYRTVVDWLTQLGERGSVERLAENQREKEWLSGELRRASHDLAAGRAAG